MISDDGQVVLVANAEIYNHRALRRQLEQRGRVFRSRNDCEVILHLYREHGINLLSRLQGPYAFALLDKELGVLWLARDRLGEKPLFYSRTLGGGVVFASELKALVAGGFVRPAIDECALMDFLRYQYVPEPETMLRNVYHLPAGHYARIELSGLRIRVQRYWSLRDAATQAPDDWATWLVEHLRHEGAELARADAELGVALSGGLDSAIAARVLTEGNPAPRGYCVGYTGRPAIDERGRALANASALGVNLTCMQLTPGDVDASFDHLVAAVDQPVADLAGPAYYALASAARADGIRGLLYGHGGDELTMGYGWLDRARQALLARPDLPLCRCRFYAYNEAVQLSVKALPRVLSPEALVEFTLGRCRHEAPAVGDSDIRRSFTELLVSNYLQSNGVAQTERISASQGVEVRLPLFDHRVVARLVRAQADLGPRLDKHALRSALGDWLPEKVGWQRKRPFLTPSRAWHAIILPKRREQIMYGQLRSSGICGPRQLEQVTRAPAALGAGTSLSYKILLFETWWAYLLSLSDPTMSQAREHA